jgi:hypothetical protein
VLEEAIIASDCLDRYLFVGHQNLEIVEFSDNRNPSEDSVEFSKRGIIKHIEEFFKFEKEEIEAEKWKVLLLKDEIRVYMKIGGS